MKSVSETAIGRIRYWWQSHPIAGLIVGWAAIALIAWQAWAALHRHAP